MPGHGRSKSAASADTTVGGEPVEGTEAPRGEERGGLSALLPALPGGVNRGRLLWLGGLGAMAAIGILEWPVAAVVGAGSLVAERFARDDVRQQRDQFETAANGR